jgi:hypothetical protein
MLMEGPLLLKNLREALDLTKRCNDVCEDFEKHRPPGIVDGWKIMKDKWEIDPSQPDPYRVVESGKPVVHTTPPILTLGFHSFESQFCKTKTCGDRSP